MTKPNFSFDGGAILVFRSKNKYKRQIDLRLGLIFSLFLVCSPVHSHESKANPEVVPAGEQDLAAKEQLEGPTETQGIASVETLGTVNLGDEFPQMTGRQLRAREITIEPGGVIAVHQHNERPGFAYILEGEIVEHRNDQAEPILRTQGQIAVEKTGVSHWWENKSDQPVRALVVDIFKPEIE